mmetsp:Transcript_7548/g.16455  ORF Transcript_7548/g.16455 Transcript_7548/m.16455 type:complete len:483 (-) Transcript_7548:90-1538(-)
MNMIGIGPSGSVSNNNGRAGPSLPASNGRRAAFAMTFVVASLFAVASERSEEISAPDPNATSNIIAPSSETSDEPIMDELISWMESEGAHIDGRISVRRVDPADPSSMRGIFADGGSFERGETLFVVPKRLIYDGEPSTAKRNAGKEYAGKDWKDATGDCGTAREIIDAMATGSTPYGRYLARQPRRVVPGYWSAAGRELLGEILGGRLSSEYPAAVADRARWDWVDCCDGAADDGELGVHAAELTTSRGDAWMMIPYYDMINHRNGRWQNTEHEGDGESLSLVTNQKVERGEQLYNSYNTCAICGGRVDLWGTLEMFIDYGFVEPFPQRYVFWSVRLKFGLDERRGGPECPEPKSDLASGERGGAGGECRESNDDDSGDDGLVVEWYVPPSQKGLDFLQGELRRLRGVRPRENESSMDDDAGGGREVPESEREASWALHRAMLVAFEAALDRAPAASDEVWNMGDDWWKDTSGAKAPHRFY